MIEDYYKAEISFLNSEISRLNRQIEADRQSRLPDKMNPTSLQESCFWNRFTELFRLQRAENIINNIIKE